MLPARFLSHTGEPRSKAASFATWPTSLVVVPNVARVKNAVFPMPDHWPRGNGGAKTGDVEMTGELRQRGDGGPGYLPTERPVFALLRFPSKSPEATIGYARSGGKSDSLEFRI